MNEKAIRKLENLSDQIERYRKIATQCATENKAHEREYVQGQGSGLLLAEQNYLLALKEAVDRA